MNSIGETRDVSVKEPNFDDFVDPIEEEEARGEEPLGSEPTEPEKEEEPTTQPVNKSAIQRMSKLKEERRLPPVPGKSLKEGEGMLWLKSLTESQMGHVDIYAYRTFPVVNMKLVDPKGYVYVQVYKGECPNMDEFTMANGGGRYSFTVNDRDMGKNGTLFKMKVDVPMTERDPIINYNALDLSDPSNKSYIQMLKSRGVLDADGKPVPLSKRGDTANMASETMIGGRVIDILEKQLDATQRTQNNRIQEELASLKKSIEGSKDTDSLGKGLSDIVIAKMNQDDPSKLVAVFAPVLSLLGKILEQPKGGDDMTKLLITMMIENQKTAQMQQQHMMELLLKNKGDTGGIGQLKETIDLLDTIRGEKEGGGKKTITEQVIEGVERIGLPVLDNVVKLWQLSKQGGATIVKPVTSPVVDKGVPGLPEPAPAQPVGTGFNPFSDPHPPTPTPNPKVVQMPTPTPVTPTPENPLVSGILSQYALILNSINQGQPGYEFAEGIINISSDSNAIKQIVGLAKMLDPNQTPEHNLGNLLAQIQLVDGTRPFAVLDSAKVMGWIEEFVHYDEYEPDGGTGEPEPSNSGPVL